MVVVLLGTGAGAGDDGAAGGGAVAFGWNRPNGAFAHDGGGFIVKPAGNHLGPL